MTSCFHVPSQKGSILFKKEIIFSHCDYGVTTSPEVNQIRMFGWFGWLGWNLTAQ